MEKKRLLVRVRDAIRSRHYSLRTEQTYIQWVRRYIYFHNKRHPEDMGEQEISLFLSYLAVERKVSASTQNQALSALLFLYKNILNLKLDWLDDVVRAKRPKRLPVVLTQHEVHALLDKMEGVNWLITSLIYGTGMRKMECLRLRQKEFTRRTSMKATVKLNPPLHLIANIQTQAGNGNTFSHLPNDLSTLAPE